MLWNGAAPRDGYVRASRDADVRACVFRRSRRPSTKLVFSKLSASRVCASISPLVLLYIDWHVVDEFGAEGNHRDFILLCLIITLLHKNRYTVIGDAISSSTQCVWKLERWHFTCWEGYGTNSGGGYGWNVW